MKKEEFLKELFRTLAEVEYEEDVNDKFADYIADIRGAYQKRTGKHA